MLQRKPKPNDSLGSDHETVSTHVTSCPTCDGHVADGQGLLACVDCGWAGIVG